MINTALSILNSVNIHVIKWWTTGMCYLWEEYADVWRHDVLKSSNVLHNELFKLYLNMMFGMKLNI